MAQARAWMTPSGDGEKEEHEDRPSADAPNRNLRGRGGPAPALQLPEEHPDWLREAGMNCIGRDGRQRA